MPSLLRLFKHGKIRGATATTLNASTSVTDSGSASINNSQGASAALAEMIPYLGSCLEDFDPDGDSKVQRQHVERRLNGEADKYANSRVEDGIAEVGMIPREWPDILLVAIKCAIQVYNQNGSEPISPGFEFKTIQSVTASMDGTTKATKFIKVVSASRSEDFPALVIAVRGSASKIDWIVNANHQLRDALELFDVSTIANPQNGEEQGVKVHSGFWNGAMALTPEVKRQLSACAQSQTIHHVIFTGHSAGGAVASLLYMHILGIAQQDYPSLRFSLVTFGSPPITAPSLTPLINGYLATQKRPGIAVAVVNEQDPITRCDRDYLLSLIQLYQRIDHPAPPSEPETNTQAHVLTESIRRVWKLPTPSLYPMGNIVVLRDANPDGEESDFRACRLPSEAFDGLLFCNVSMHKKDVYLSRIELLKAGQFGNLAH